MEACKALRGLTADASNPFPKELEHLLKIENPQGQIAGLHVYYLLLRLMLLYFQGLYKSCVEVADLLLRFEGVHQLSNPLWIMFYLYYPLALTEIYPEGNWKQKRIWRKEITRCQKKLKTWAQFCPENFLHKQLLLSAEESRILNRKHLIFNSLNRAIVEAKKQGFLQEAALAYELLAKFYVDLDQTPLAISYMQEAYHAYERWGAHSKLKQLIEKYPALFIQSAASQESALNAQLVTKDTTTVTTLSSSTEFDINSIAQSYQTISGEIVLDKLLGKLMHIVIVNAGADQAYLILADQKQLVVHASITLEEEGGALIKPIPLEEKSNELCLAIVYYVQRSKQVLFLHDATKEGNFIQDPYVLKHHPQSILCLPLIRQGYLIGILYLENKISKGAFSPERLRILTLLSSQMAISIENALFYAQLETKVEERTLALKEKNQELEQAFRRLQVMQNQLIQQEKMASLGIVISGMAHELKNPLNFVINFSELSHNIIEEVDKTVHEYMGQAPLEIKEDTHESLQVLKSNLASIKDQGQRIDIIVKRMSEHAAQQTGKLVGVPLHKFLDEAISVFKERWQTQHMPLKVTMEKGYDSSIENVKMSAEDMFRVVYNLLDNAFYALALKKQIGDVGFIPKLTIETHNLGRQVEIRIHDNGLGIPESIRDQIFNPFFTNKPAGTGMGLGLSLAYNIVVMQHAGTLTFNSVEGQYAEFIITLPHADQRNF